MGELDIAKVYKMLIDGALVEGTRTMEVVNPATEQAIANCSRGSLEDFDAAVRAARAAQPSWGARPMPERRAALIAIADAIDARRDELARLLTLEQGKPLADACGEIQITAAFFRHTAELSLEVETIEDSHRRRIEIHRKPLGVVAAIIP